MSCYSKEWVYVGKHPVDRENDRQGFHSKSFGAHIRLVIGLRLSIGCHCPFFFGVRKKEERIRTPSPDVLSMALATDVAIPRLVGTARGLPRLGWAHAQSRQS